MKQSILILLLALPALALGNSIRPDVIYGEDDRLDLYQVEDPAHLLLAHATVGLVSSRDLNKNGNAYALKTKNYGNSYNLCESEPFREQRTGAFCSGFLVAPDIIVTAGHCIRNQPSCESTSFVFDFAIFEDGGATPTSLPEDNVYHCKKVLQSQVHGGGSDFAVVQIDRAVVNRTPVSVRRTGSITPGTDLTVIGHPAGLPTKVAGGASVRSLANGYFVANLDTYGGNSGSAVFNSATGVVEGILVRGELDFVYKDGCRMSNVCKDDECRGEDVTTITETVPWLPQ